MTYDALYQALRRIAWLRSAVQTLRAVVERLRVEVWIIEGSGRHGGGPLKVLIAGQQEAKSYIAELLFRSPRTETRRVMWRSLLRREATARRSKFMMVFVDVEAQRPPKREHTNVFWSRGWVRTELDLARAAERMRRSDGIKSDLRKVRENGLSCDAVTDQEAFERFYWDMYVPYARREFGGKAIYMNHEQFLAGLKNGELLRIQKGGRVIAGMIILYHDESEPQWWLLGMQDGDRNLARQGALAALYFYGVQHLIERGYSRALLGGVRPFLADGVLQYKRKWGATLLSGDDGDPHWFAVAVTQPTEAVRHFLKASPLICENDQSLVGRVFFDEGDPENDERIQRQTAELSALGIARVQATGLPRIDTESDVVLRSAAQQTGDLAGEDDRSIARSSMRHRGVGVVSNQDR